MIGYQDYRWAAEKETGYLGWNNVSAAAAET